MSLLGSPASSNNAAGKGIRALVLAPTRELAHQIHNECLKLAQGRKWKVILFSKATANTLTDKRVQEKVGQYMRSSSLRANCMLIFTFELRFHSHLDVVISTPLRMVAAIQNGSLDLSKYVLSCLQAIRLVLIRRS